MSDGEATGAEMSDSGTERKKKKSIKLRIGGGSISPSGSRAGSPINGSRAGSPAAAAKAQQGMFEKLSLRQ
jgi:hypothetical protein